MPHQSQRSLYAASPWISHIELLVLMIHDAKA
jgi:hypothetical protein